MLLTPVGMDNNGQFRIAASADRLVSLDNVDNTSDLNKPISTAAQTAFNAKQATITLGTTAQYIRGDLTLATFPSLATVATTGAYSDLTGKPTIPAAQIQSDWTQASSGSLDFIKNKPSIPSIARTTSVLSLSLVGTGATGTQISSTKDSTVRCNVSTSTTSTIGGPSTSLVALKICATNNATEGSWTTVATLESDQTITLALVLNSIQVMKGQICSEVPAGWFTKLVNSGTGTHSETSITGQQTIYG